jgi:hypothetical protein
MDQCTNSSLPAGGEGCKTAEYPPEAVALGNENEYDDEYEVSHLALFLIFVLVLDQRIFEIA